jgi:hypothetical protein
LPKRITVWSEESPNANRSCCENDLTRFSAALRFKFAIQVLTVWSEESPNANRSCCENDLTRFSAAQHRGMLPTRECLRFKFYVIATNIALSSSSSSLSLVLLFADMAVMNPYRSYPSNMERDYHRAVDHRLVVRNLKICTMKVLDLLAQLAQKQVAG